MTPEGPECAVYQPHPMGYRPAGDQSPRRKPKIPYPSSPSAPPRRPGLSSRPGSCLSPCSGPSPRRRPLALLKIAPLPAVVIALILVNTGALNTLFPPRRSPGAAEFPSAPSPEHPLAVPVHKASLEPPDPPGSVPRAVFTRHNVQRNETLARIAYQYGLATSTLISVNRLSGPRDIAPGRRLIVPYRDGRRIEARPDESAAEAALRIGASPGTLQSLPGGDFFIPGAQTAPHPGYTPGDALFLHPAAGPVITPFGSGVDTLTGIPYDSEGIELAAERGSPILAARDGTVILTGSHPSYGLYVIMSHPERWRSFYGHLERIEVAPGDRPRAGEALGTAGDSGIARSPRLLFVLIQNGELVDPLDYL